MRPGRGRPWGFTLIELMLVVAIIGLLASIAIPKFGGLVIRSKEAAVKGKLGSLRSAISIYYAENEGEFPTNAHWLVPKYLDEIPSCSIPTVADHVEGNRIRNILSLPGPHETGGPLWDWFEPLIPPGTPYIFLVPTGRVYINCIHTDSQGVLWSVF
ncbi:MAG: prepilin-type N-terminal cleavage/methylation domain-containing protein [Elusimicrobia bacterium]|nr:prepilin-type N-terminal cleavage/methylation domain-containing protein [Elusimicrobiota bacterium]